ncbi:helix-turn-helix domain-containing protein [Pseudoalteromonas shioyasakiensis]|uniref:helix-turn-helix domain-containing protein n=1 Tax=Pseudoalteromonas shioyasakiensis TaxID=1190813 RepID=UPI0022B17905|nr:helix-turn-helix domain-containing protein [Pseudoalteromonas shioyasakiensis]MCZ4251458.1 helix-turn-helix domain-containing protein [Pseudoalteromonas shioyasakiensis]
MIITKTKSSFYRRVFIAALIEEGFDTIPKIATEIGAPRRTIQDTINALKEIDIECNFEGANKNGSYAINSWGPINKVWVMNNLDNIRQTLKY